MKKFLAICIIFMLVFAQLPFFVFADENNSGESNSYDYSSYGYNSDENKTSETEHYTDTLKCLEDEYELPLYQSASVLVMCADTGEVFYETEGFTLRYPASVTKVMTALLVLENVENLDEPVVFSEYAIDIPEYASRIWMHEGESISVREALYGIMLSSGNEVARALAEHVNDTVPAFIMRMNQRAWELGAVNTRFINPCGLPGDEQFTTAYDIALIMREAVKHPVFVEIISTPYFELPPTNYYYNTRLLRNTNRLIRVDEPEYNLYVIGGKTGFTNAAQHTLVSYVQKEEFRFIVSVMYAPRGATFTDTTALINLVYKMLTAPEEEEIDEYEPGEEIAYEAETVYEPADEPIVEIVVLPEGNTETTDDVVLPEDNLHGENNGHIETTNREAFVVASASLATVILGLLVVLVYGKRKGRGW